MQHVVITGASSGIGAALAQALALDGFAPHVCARRADRLDQAFGYPCDVSKEEQVRKFVFWIRARTPHVDALVNCAGSFGAIGPVLQTDSREWLKTIEVNLYGTYLMIKHVAPLMVPGSSIINFSGGGAFSPFPNYSAYAASKAAVVRLTETLAIELAPKGIRVNAVAPGFVATEIHEATLLAGRVMAGAEHFEQTQRVLRKGSVPIEVPVACARFLLSCELTGKTISASFDPWDTPEFEESIPQINQSDLYTLRRINPVNLPEMELLF